MALKDHLPSTAVVAARLGRTWATIWGMVDRAERRNRTEAVERLRRQPTAAKVGPRILVFSFRGWQTHTAWETVLAHGLRLRGADVHIFNCGGRLPICEVNARHASSHIACAECAAYPKRLVEDLGFSRSWLRDYVSADEQFKIERDVNYLRAEELGTWVFDGQPIGALVRDSVIWFLRKTTLNLEGSDAKVYRDFLISGAQIARLAPRLLAAVRPEVLLELNGQFFVERILNRFAGQTALVTYEAGWRSDTLGFDRTSAAGPVDLDEDWKRFGLLSLSEQEDQTLDQWMRERSAGNMQRDFYIRFEQRGASVLQQLGLDPERSTAVLFTNIVWDTAVLGRNVAFCSIQDWLARTIEIFRGWPERQLIIRIHPAEDLRPSQESLEKLSELPELKHLPANIRLVGSREALNSYDLMNACQLGLVYTSTAGLEMALRRKPVVVAARVYYRNRGFTWDAQDDNRYSALLESAFGAPDLNSEQVKLARRFAYLLLFRYLHRIPVVQLRPGRLPMLKPEEVDLLLPGALPELDELFKNLAAGQGFVSQPERINSSTGYCRT